MTPGRIVPPAPAMLYYELREAYGLGRVVEPWRLSEMAARYEKTPQAITNWLAVLEGAGLIERESHRPYEGRAIIIKPVPERERFRPCVRCQVRERRANTGRMCARCKELTRKGRRWRPEAIRMAKAGHTEMQIYLRLVKKYPEVTLFDKPPDPNEPGSRGSPGVISVLHEVELASPEWLEAHIERGGSLSQRRMRRVRNRKGED